MTKLQAIFLRKLLKFFGKAILAFVLFTLVLVTYAKLKVTWAKKQVEAFSSIVVIGQSVAELGKQAKKMHLNYKQIGDSNEKDGRFYVWEGFAFERWFCDVEYKDGKATSKKVTFLD